MEVSAVVLVTLGVLCAGVAVLGRRTPPGRRRAREHLALGALLLVVAGAALGLAPATASPQDPPATAGAQGLRGVATRCDALLQPYAVVPQGDVGPIVQVPFWTGYAHALRELAAEVRLLEVPPHTRPAVDDLLAALDARAASIDLEVHTVAVGGWGAHSAAARAGTVRDVELGMALRALGLTACANP
ncbi:hypothetical protein [Kineococcus rubinsiae]|uniref:hypothetical protein n=1 Tax=Kineococcus rubinsiae TaxID=2609562 RepID=UPI00142F90F0|nr:hypothetical protein [Kineococcus rubinsiae]NIZ90441.1 hypothetical protein [Kineococcus rubinsiae]